MQGEYGDWTDHWRRITGEKYSIESFNRRCHPEDHARIMLAWDVAQKGGRFDETYRLRDASWRYVKVRGLVLHIFDEWIGAIELVSDWPNMHEVFPFTYRN